MYKGSSDLRLSDRASARTVFRPRPIVRSSDADVVSRIMEIVDQIKSGTRSTTPIGAWTFHTALAAIIKAIVLVLSLGAGPGFAQSAENVAVVINEASPASVRIGEHYIRARRIPQENVIRIRTSTNETINRAGYVNTIDGPISAAISSRTVHDRILYIVLTKGVPLRISGTDGADGTVSSVDSELTLLYRRLTGTTTPARGRVSNPYFLGTSPIRTAQPFTHRAHDIFLVSRLDAFTVDEAIALIDRAQAPVSEGVIVLDQRAALLGDGTGDRWLLEAARRLRDLGDGDRVVLDETSRGARDVKNVLGYYSWGSNDPANRVRRFNLGFVPGALAATFVSSDGRTFQNPPDEWVPTGNSVDRKTWFGGSPQSLIGDLIREGATGVAAHVAEPYLQSTIRPEILFPVYLAGFNLIEAFYLATPDLSWQTIIIGDPLCTAFPRNVLTRDDIEEAVDPATELPSLFSKRRLQMAQLAAKGAPAQAVTLIVLAEARRARGDNAGARTALEKAAELAPTILGAQMQLALLYEQTGDFAAAVDRYRTILKLQPNNASVLNNLAFHLAVRQNAAAEALPLARKAASLEPKNGSVLDTLGWVEHLLGNHDSAAKILSQAIQLSPASGGIRLHAAIVSAALNNMKEAQAHLNEALRLNPELEQRDEVAELRKLLKRAG